MENDIQPNQSTVLSTPEVITQAPRNNYLKAFLFTVLGLIILALVFYIGVQVGKSQTLDRQSILSQPIAPKIPTSSNPIDQPNSNPEVIPTQNWPTYSSILNNFKINYPIGWRKVEDANFVGFGPQEIGEDVLWAVSFYDKTKMTIPQIKDDIGKQFSDRKQTEKTITLDGLSATEVVTTTNQYPDWHSVTIIIDSEDTLYAISNGAQSDAAFNKMLLGRTGEENAISFEDFYSSFRLTN